MPNIKKSQKTTVEKTQTYNARTQQERALAQAFLSLKKEQDVLDFLRDLMTVAEIEEFSHRLEIARLLKKGEKSYIEIAAGVGTSTTTVTRVAQWLFHGCGGYVKALKKT